MAMPGAFPASALNSTTSVDRTFPKRGLFANNIWMCDCKPRLPAERFQVGKHTANFGRWFYTCQKSKDNGCGFFLWEDDAKPRMEAAVLSNSGSEPTGLADQQRAASPSKRKLDVATMPSRAPETPRKLNRTEDKLTPTHRPTQESDGMVTPGTTPQKRRTLGEAAPNADAAAERTNKDLGTEAFDILARSGLQLPSEAADQLRVLFQKHEMQRQGILKGREISRAGIASRDGTIALQSQQIAALETQVEERARPLQDEPRDTDDQAPDQVEMREIDASAVSDVLAGIQAALDQVLLALQFRRARRAAYSHAMTKAAATYRLAPTVSATSLKSNLSLPDSSGRLPRRQRSVRFDVDESEDAGEEHRGRAPHPGMYARDSPFRQSWSSASASGDSINLEDFLVDSDNHPYAAMLAAQRAALAMASRDQQPDSAGPGHSGFAEHLAQVLHRLKLGSDKISGS